MPFKDDDERREYMKKYMKKYMRKRRRAARSDAEFGRLLKLLKRIWKKRRRV